jgi:hypothetical protein
LKKKSKNIPPKIGLTAKIVVKEANWGFEVLDAVREEIVCLFLF